MTASSYFSIDPQRRHVFLDGNHPGFYENPNHAYAALHARCPTFFWEQKAQWCFTHYDTVNNLLRDRRFGRQILHIASRKELGMDEPQPHLAAFDLAERYNLLELEPPEHTRLRTLINRAFVSRFVEKMRPEIEALAHRLIDAFEPAGKTELRSSFAEIIPVTVISRMIGIPEEMNRHILAWSHAYVRMYVFGRTTQDEHTANTAAQEFSDYVRSLIKERRNDPREDLLTHMIHTRHQDQYLSDDEVVSTVIVLLIAGHEATVHQIGNSVRLILESGVDPKTVFADDASTSRTVEETLRLCAPVHLFQRWVLEPVEIDGISFDRGDQITLLLAAANLDPTRFTDPLRFQPDRNEGPHLSFGAGIHFCIGAPLARLELNTVLPVLFQKLPGLRLTGQPQIQDIYHFHGVDALNVTW